MDDMRFDNLTRKLATGASRRSMLKGLTAALVGGLARLAGGRSTAAQACTPTRYRCRNDEDCCSGACVGMICQEAGTPNDCDADLRIDPNNCGECGNECGENEICANTVCRDCGPWMAPCNGYCYRACPPGQTFNADCSCVPICLALCEPCEPTDNQCCHEFGASCMHRDDCCAVPEGFARRVNCSPTTGTCGGPGADCLTNETCASGVCCRRALVGTCCADGQACDFDAVECVTP